MAACSHKFIVLFNLRNKLRYVLETSKRLMSDVMGISAKPVRTGAGHQRVPRNTDVRYMPNIFEKFLSKTTFLETLN